jgi:hypothetical protein
MEQDSRYLSETIPTKVSLVKDLFLKQLGMLKCAHQ